MVDLPAKRKSFNELITALEGNERRLIARVADAPDTPKNRKLLRHVIGIERWGQRRLQTLLGEPFIQDEYDGYQPADSLSFPELRETFSQTRRASVALAQELQRRNVAKTAIVRHNDAGDMSVAGWLRYFALHATGEMRRIK
jgi:hypothetical protein